MKYLFLRSEKKRERRARKFEISDRTVRRKNSARESPCKEQRWVTSQRTKRFLTREGVGKQRCDAVRKQFV
jgi:hypothetical protein